MKSLGIFFVFLFFQLSIKAEIIYLPDHCFEKKVSPCLVRALTSEKLFDKKNKIEFHLNENTIVKWLGFEENLKLDLLQGQIKVSRENQKRIDFVLNEIKFSTSDLFALRSENKLSLFDCRTFVLSSYELNVVQKKESILVRSEFPTKAEMIEFVSLFYSSKKELLSFLKKIESPWQKEFKVQTELQTKVLQRSVASIENAENEKKLKQQREAEALKKVRDLFFYRTFYR